MVNEEVAARKTFHFAEGETKAREEQKLAERLDPESPDSQFDIITSSVFNPHGYAISAPLSREVVIFLPIS